MSISKNNLNFIYRRVRDTPNKWSKSTRSNYKVCKVMY